MRLNVSITFLLLVMAAAGCGGETSDVAAPATVTVIETVGSAGASAGETAPPSAPAPAPQPPPAEGAGNIAVPDVVGMDHQLAQDTMQAAGLYNLSEEDATGQGRLLLYDRNWTVVEQDPPGGTQVSEDQTIVLRSKKDGE